MMRLLPLSVVALLIGVAPLSARTIIFSESDCKYMAAITAEAPRLSWAAFEASTGDFNGAYMEMFPRRAFLIRYPIERIPKGQRITDAQWIFSSRHKGAGEVRLSVRRLLVEWGAGVCYQYRMTRPTKVEWSTPGALGPSTDRVAKPSSVVRVQETGEHVVNVTEDVELWYTGAAPNYGWMLSLDDAGAYLRLTSPVWTTRGQWKLRITYEPE
jgi:hypothetical protein